MTLEPYTPARLDEMALRLVDLCSRVRAMSQRCTAEQLESFPLHDKKAQEWLGKLEEWLERAEGDLNLKMLKHRGVRKARQAARESIDAALSKSAEVSAEA